MNVRPLRSALLLVVLVAVTPAVAKVPLKVCKETCAVLVAGDCAALPKKRLKRCCAKVWRQCKRGRLACVAKSTTLPPGSGPVCVLFFEVRDQLPGGTDQSVASGDLNGDGRRDLVVVANPAAMVRLGNGDGTFGPVAGYDVGGDGRGVAVADLNADGRLDLAVANFSSTRPPTGPSTVVNVSVLLGNGDGTVAPPVPYFVGIAAYRAEVVIIIMGADDAATVPWGVLRAVYEAPERNVGIGKSGRVRRDGALS